MADEKQESNQNHYELLELERTANDVEIRKAYKKFALKYHPDKNPDNIEHASFMFDRLSKALELLTDPELRREYDSQLDKRELQEKNLAKLRTDRLKAKLDLEKRERESMQVATDAAGHTNATAKRIAELKAQGLDHRRVFSAHSKDSANNSGTLESSDGSKLADAKVEEPAEDPPLIKVRFKKEGDYRQLAESYGLIKVFRTIGKSCIIGYSLQSSLNKFQIAYKRGKLKAVKNVVFDYGTSA